MLTLGTAGHIDHGKTSLIKALTSIDTDRLPEEKERGMTIDLGFAWLKLASGETIGIVDVPGHKQFINHVAPGLFGIDAVLLLVAADDGWMPQTEEHFQILNLLGIKNGMVVLNKIDIAPDAEWLNLVEADINQRLAGTPLAGSPVIRVSARTGEGIDRLTAAITALAARLTPRQDIGKPRLAVDRVFTMKGSGVVVTGTLNQGVFNAGDEVAAWPSGLEGRIRSIESYKQTLGQVQPGSRVALNLSGFKREELNRGDIILSQRQKPPLAREIDIELRLLPLLDAPLKNMTEVLVYMETRELLARVVLLESRVLNSGETGLAQLRFTENVSSFIGERFIMRRQSPATTIGGGTVLNPLAARYKPSHLPGVLAALNTGRSLSLQDLILAEVERQKMADARGLLSASLFTAADVSRGVEDLLSRKKLVQASGYLISPARWQEWIKVIIDTVSRGIEAEKLKKGVPQSAVQSALGQPKELFDALLANLLAEGKLVRENDVLYLPEHKPRLSAEQEKLAAAVLEMFHKNPTTPPALRDILAQFPAAGSVVRFMLQQGQIIEFPEYVLMEAGRFAEIQRQIIEMLKEKGQVSIQDISARFGFSRKYSIPLMTQLDRLGITRREGDVRVAGRKTAV
jgi:selenocysteine-specific elongation factor